MFGKLFVIREIINEIDLVVQAFAKKNDYDVVLKDKSLLYKRKNYDFTQKHDLTQKITDRLNAEYRAKR